MIRENIYGEDPSLWVIFRDKLFTRRRKRRLYKKLLNKLGMTQRVIRERDLLFLSVFVSTVCYIPFQNP